MGTMWVSELTINSCVSLLNRNMAYASRYGPLDPLGVRYGRERIYISYTSHKTIVEAPNPDLFLLFPCTGDPKLLVKPWGGMWENGKPVGTTLLKTVHRVEGPQWCSHVATIVNKCSCGQEPCLERIPFVLSDPPSIAIYNSGSLQRGEWSDLLHPPPWRMVGGSWSQYEGYFWRAAHSRVP